MVLDPFVWYLLAAGPVVVAAGYLLHKDTVAIIGSVFTAMVAGLVGFLGIAVTIISG